MQSDGHRPCIHVATCVKMAAFSVRSPAGHDLPERCTAGVNVRAPLPVETFGERISASTCPSKEIVG